jgi:hypothetical protein
MKTVKTAIALIATATLAAAPSAALGADPAVVPPSNPAASQYTEAYPTGGGERDVHKQGSSRSPEEVLGKDEAERLEAYGPEGQAAADLAAETAPPASGRSTAGGSSNGNGNGGSRSSTTSGQGGGSAPSSVASPSGSGGVDAVLAQATGTSSGEMGLFLPILIVGAIVWALLYLRRERRDVA